MGIRKIASWLLICIGLLPCTSYILSHLGFTSIGTKILFIGRITVAAPWPIAFSSERGYEAYTADVWLKLKLKNNKEILVKEDHLMSAKRGSSPFSRRNIYHASFAWGPRMP